MKTKPIKIPKVPKKVVKPRVPRTRNMNTETESQHMTKLRWALRKMTAYAWKPISAVRKAAQRGYGTVLSKGKVKRLPVYQCAICGDISAKVQVDHINPAGSLKSYADLPAFCERLFCEDISQLRVLCAPCHKKVTLETENQ